VSTLREQDALTGFDESPMRMGVPAGSIGFS